MRGDRNYAIILSFATEKGHLNLPSTAGDLAATTEETSANVQLPKGEVRCTTDAIRTQLAVEIRA
jgi:hypothetical protein